MRKVIWLATVLIAVGTGWVRAHDIVVWAEVADGRLVVEAYLTDGLAPQEATVTVQDGDGVTLVEAQMDSSGRFSAPLPADLPLVIRVAAGPGHAGSAVLTEEGLGSAAGSR